MGNRLETEQGLKRNTHLHMTLLCFSRLSNSILIYPCLILCGILTYSKRELEIKRIKQNSKTALSVLYACRQLQGFTLALSSPCRNSTK